ncbi:MAG: 3-deoxy-D-manno-octulosonic acid transferase [Planctomycetota bacterium]|jgi:3-deoxy-D-manno-octulosonic-acid transferase
MAWLIDLVYLIAAVASSPVWLVRMVRTGKIRTDWAGRFGRAEPLPPPRRPRILVHAVSVGEVNAARKLLARLAGPPLEAEIVVCSTTNTGCARAEALFGGSYRVARYPLDFSFAVNRFLRAVRPDVAVLMELEVWPNFVRAAARRGVPVCVVNGRLTERSAAGYRRLGAVVRPMFARLTFAAVQNEPYARRFREVGVPANRVHVTGTMKWDTAEIADAVEGADALAEAMGIDRSLPLVVAGSTAPGEHELLVEAVADGVQLLCAPRKPEWFDQAAAAMPGCARRSRGDRGSATGRFLLDTIGELRAAYALADVVVVGRSFGNLHGSDMMEPVALGAATIVGPAVADFQDTVDALLAGDGLVQTDREHLAAAIRQLLDDPERRPALAANARRIIRAQQGATARNADLIRALIEETLAAGREVTS